MDEVFPFANRNSRRVALIRKTRKPGLICEASISYFEMDSSSELVNGYVVITLLLTHLKRTEWNPGIGFFLVRDLGGFPTWARMKNFNPWLICPCFFKGCVMRVFSVEHLSRLGPNVSLKPETTCLLRKDTRG